MSKEKKCDWCDETIITLIQNVSGEFCSDDCAADGRKAQIDEDSWMYQAKN